MSLQRRNGRFSALVPAVGLVGALLCAMSVAPVRGQDGLLTRGAAAADSAQAQAALAAEAAVPARPLAGPSPSGQPLAAEIAGSILDEVQGPGLTAQPTVIGGGERFFVGFGLEPKAGIRANVNYYEYYAELDAEVQLRKSGRVRNETGWGYQNYRKYERTLQNRENQLTYAAGYELPMILSVVGRWNWSEDKTTNTVGSANVIKRDDGLGNLVMRKNEIRTGALKHNLSGTLGVRNLFGSNRDVVNRTDEGEGAAHLQTGWDLTEGVTLAGRLYGKTAGGERQLRHRTDGSSAMGDTVGAGAYYDRGWVEGRAHLTKSSFESEFLDWKRGETGSPDTVGVPVEDQIVREREVKEKTALVFENKLRFGRVGFEFDLARSFDQTSYAKSNVGTRENADESMDLEATFAAGRDSFVAAYRYKWRWDDQVNGEGLARGRQNRITRAADFNWFHTLFRATDLRVSVGQQLGQDIPDNRPNGQNRDRLTTDAGVQLRRTWTRFRTALGFSWRRDQTISINASQSAANNAQDEYNLEPNYNWTVARWLRFSQRYRLTIQYTDNDYPTNSRRDNYNKTGVLNTFFTITPTRRLEVSIKHDFQRLFNADRTGTAPDGGATYSKNKIQNISTINLAMEFEAADGVLLEASTWHKNDDTEFPLDESKNTTLSGELWVGVVLRRRWGRTNPLELSAQVKKFNAFGPSVQPTSADYWVADVWLKRSF